MSNKRDLLLASFNTNMYMSKAICKYDKQLSDDYLSKAKRDARLYQELLNQYKQDNTITLKGVIYEGKSSNGK